VSAVLERPFAPQRVEWAEPRTEADASAWANFVAQYACDPLGFVCAVFPWGVPGTQLEDESGPDSWQALVLDEIGKQLRAGIQTIRIAVASGHGIGKTALMSWITIWFQSCYPRNKERVTAGTLAQLKSATWRELAKWKELAANRWQFEWTAEKFSCKWQPETWYAEAVAWSEHNPQAFAGLHEEIVMVQFDEASTIASAIWEVTEGAFTTRGIFLAFGNPSDPDGAFADCFGKNAKYWTLLRVDSRDSRKANKEWIEKTIEQWGIDSDYVRVRVLGLFPLHGGLSFISPQMITKAVERHKAFDAKEIPRSIPLLMGVDVARQGADQSVVRLRKGRYVLPEVYRYRIPDMMQIASHVAALIRTHEPDVVYIDETGGYGAGVIDRLRQLGFVVIGVQFGAAADEAKKYTNRRAEIWSRMRDWLRNEGMLPDDLQLRISLETLGYGYDTRTDRLKMESKDDVRARGGNSPDDGDALAMTFTELVPVKMMDEGISFEPEVV